MSKSKFKEIEIRLRPASTLPDATCVDGEVAEFSNVDWLKNLIDSSSGSGNGSSSAKPDSTSSPSTYLSLTSESFPVTLPYGSTLLAIHSPDVLAGQPRYLILTAPDSLAIMDPEAESSLTYLSGNVSTKYGEIRRAIPFGNFILLLTSNGLRWIIFNPDTRVYTLTDTFPECPQVEFKLTPAVLSEYNSAAGSRPELQVSVDLTLHTELTETMLHNWLDSGTGSAVDDEVKIKVYRAIGKAVEDYESAVKARGMFLTPPKCVASFDRTLPSAVTIPDMTDTYNYDSPYALLASWGFQGGILSLKIYFSLIPMRLSANYTFPASQKIWISLFGSLEISSSQSENWHEPGKSLYASSFTSFINPSTGQRDGNAFRFASALSRTELYQRLDDCKEMRSIKKIKIGDATSGLVYLQNHESYNWKALIPFTPDYRDFTKVEPRDGTLTDQGFILFGGNIEVQDAEGNVTSLSLEKGIIAGIPDYPFIFRYYCHVGEGNIVAVVQCNGSRTSSISGRHPIHVLSTDGIRILAADGEGGYLNARLLSRHAVSPDYPVASGNDKAFFSTNSGLTSLSMNSSITTLGAFLPEDDWESMCVLDDDDSLLLTAPGRTGIFDLKQKVFFNQEDISIRSLVRYEGNAIASYTDGSLCCLHSLRSLSSETDSDTSASDIISNIPPESIEARILTRPLKLGAASKRKRIAGVTTTHESIKIEIECSDNLYDWHPLLTRFVRTSPLPPSSSRLSGYALPGHRYFRLRASAPVNLAGHLDSITLLLRQ